MKFTTSMPVPSGTVFTQEALQQFLGPTVLKNEISGADASTVVTDARVEDGYLWLTMETDDRSIIELLRPSGTYDPPGWEAPEASDLTVSLAAMDEVRRRATEIYLTGGVDLWLSSPNRLLGNRTPVEAVEQGDSEAVLRILDMLASGAHL